MKALGISIYPENGTVEAFKDYIKLASSYGFSRIFTCLISVEGDKENVINEFREIIEFGIAHGMETIADVSPDVFKALDLDYTDLSFFKDLGLSGIRLDLGFSGHEESIMTYNTYGLKIDINMSGGTKYIDTILSYDPKKSNLVGCHNFYPHRYTGLSREHFLKCSRQFKAYDLTTAAFVSSSDAEFGPWPVSEGLCTLEEHRDLPIGAQAKDLFSTGLIDVVIIGNCFASEEELRLLGELNKDILTLNVELIDGIPEVERKIVLEEPHFNRGDVSEYMLRSTMSRVKYKGHDFALFNPEDIKRGDLIIDSSLYTRYAGELQVALKDMKNSGRTNVVGRIVEEEHHLLDHIGPWVKFAFVERT